MALGPAPTQAVIPWGVGAGGGATRPPLDRLLTDCARFGFDRTLILVPEGADAPDLQPGLTLGTEVQVVPVSAAHVPGALVEIAARLDTLFALLDPAVVLDTNWLNLIPPLATADHAVAVVAASGPFALSDGRVLAWADANGPPYAPAGIYLLARDGLASAAGCCDISAMLLYLTRTSRVAGIAVAVASVLRVHDRPPVRARRPALFLDRDGTLNEDYGYVSDPARLVLLPGAIAAVKRANDLGWYVFLVTNQSGVGRGYYEEAQVLLCNAALQQHLRAAGAHLDDIRYAPDHPEAALPRYRSTSNWRKPGPGMLIDLMAHWPVQAEASLMVGDKDSDVQAGMAAGLRSLLFAGGDLDAFLSPHLAVT